MLFISSALKGALEAAEAIPGWGLIFCAFDIIDEFVMKTILTDSFGRGMTLKSYLAEFLYNVLNGDYGAVTLDDKRKRMEEELAYYNSTYGANLNYDQFNDFVNNAGALDTLWRGKMKFTSSGHLNYTKDGGRGKTLAGYAKDAATYVGNAYNNLGWGAKQGIQSVARGAVSLTPLGAAAGIAQGAYNLYNGAKSLISNVGGPTPSFVDKFNSWNDQRQNAAAATGSADKFNIADNFNSWKDQKRDAATANTSSGNNTSTSAWGKISGSMSKMKDKIVSANQAYIDSLPDDDKRQYIAEATDFKTGMPASVFKKVYSEGYDFSGNPLGVRSVITSGYGYRNIAGHPEFHYGVDMVPASGSANVNVSSPVEGTVTYVKRDVSNSTTGLDVSDPTLQTGNMITILGKDGLKRKFMHLGWNTIPTDIKEGSKVKNGTIIGKVGSTGRSDGAHLHYQIEESNGHAVDPLNYLMKAYNKSNKKQELQDALDTYIADDEYGIEYQPYNGAEESGANDKGLLGNLLSTLSSISSNFLYHITGGLIGSRYSNDSSISDDQTTNVSSVNDFLRMVAAEIGTKENPPGSNNVKYNTWYYQKEVSGDGYMWCMVFVQWCFDHAGLPLPKKTAACLDLWDWYQTNDPSKCHKRSPQPGDIAIFSRGNGGHTGIVEKVLGDSYYTIEGNCGDEVKRNTSHKVGDSNLVGFITAVNFANLKSVSSSLSSDNVSGTGNRPLPAGLGRSKVFMGWQTITSPSSKQYALRKDAGQNFDSQGFAKIGDRYVVAMKPYFGDVGDFVDITLDNGQTIRAVIGDIKANENAGVEFAKYAHGNTVDNSSVVEFVVDKNSWYKKNANGSYVNSVTGLHPEWNATVASVNNVGNYWARGGPVTTTPQTSQSKKRGVGGPSLHASNYIANSRAARQNSAASYSRSSNAMYSTASIPRPTARAQSYSYAGQSSTDINGVVTLLTRAVEELTKITNNTASSSDLLVSLNEKDFVDQGVRDSINALGKASKSKKRTDYPQTSARAALDIANP